jgi:hypothetical protein
MEATDSYFVIGLLQNVSAMGGEFTLLTQNHSQLILALSRIYNGDKDPLL